MIVSLRRVVLLLFVLLATACGSTVQTTSTGAAGGGGGTGLGQAPASDGLGGGSVAGAPADGNGSTAGGQALPDGSVLPGSGPGTVQTGSGSSGGATGGGAGPARVSGPSGGGSGLAAKGPGWDEKSLFIGFATQKGANEAVAAAGAGAISFGDPEAQAKAVVNAINKRGTVLGRKLVPVFHDVATEDSPQTSAQEACTAFTQDRRVVAVVNIVAAIDNEVLYDCLAKAGVAVSNASFLAADSARFARYPDILYSLAMPAYDAFTATHAERLKQLQYFTGWNPTTGAKGPNPVKLGLLYPADPTGKRIASVVRKTFAGAGFPVVADYGYDRSAADFGTAGVSNSVLRFRNDGVTHVLSVDGVVQVFMTAAAQQEYRPRYALSSFVQPQLLQTAAPASQLIGSVGIGWLPGLDVDAANDPGKGPGEAACKRVMKDAGQDLSNRATEIVALSVCDGFELFARAAGVSGGFDVRALRTGAERLGSGLPIASAFTNGLSARKHWVPGVYRDLNYVSSCSCFRYLDKTNRPL